MAAYQNLVLRSFFCSSSCNSLGYLQSRLFHCPPPCIPLNLKSCYNQPRIVITHAKKKRNSPLVREEKQQVDVDIAAELEEDNFDDFEKEDGEFSNDDDDFDEDLYESDEGWRWRWWRWNFTSWDDVG